MVSVERLLKLLNWATGDDTGVSSEYLMRYMLGFEVKAYCAPSDQWDRERCIRLLNIIPEWWDRIEEVRESWGEHVDLLIQERTNI